MDEKDLRVGFKGFYEPCYRCGKYIWCRYKDNVDMEVCKVCRFRIRYDMGKLGYLFDILRKRLRRSK